jgi:hypothetical protein
VELTLPADLASSYLVVRIRAIRGEAPAPRPFEAHLRMDGSARLVGVRH